MNKSTQWKRACVKKVCVKTLRVRHPRLKVKQKWSVKTEPLNERVASLTGTEAQRVSASTAETPVPNCALVLQTLGAVWLVTLWNNKLQKTSADPPICKSRTYANNCTPRYLWRGLERSVNGATLSWCLLIILVSFVRCGKDFETWQVPSQLFTMSCNIMHTNKIETVMIRPQSTSEHSYKLLHFHELYCLFWHVCLEVGGTMNKSTCRNKNVCLHTRFCSCNDVLMCKILWVLGPFRFSKTK